MNFKKLDFGEIFIIIGVILLIYLFVDVAIGDNRQGEICEEIDCAGYFDEPDFRY